MCFHDDSEMSVRSRFTTTKWTRHPKSTQIWHDWKRVIVHKPRLALVPTPLRSIRNMSQKMLQWSWLQKPNCFSWEPYSSLMTIVYTYIQRMRRTRYPHATAQCTKLLFRHRLQKAPTCGYSNIINKLGFQITHCWTKTRPSINDI